MINNLTALDWDFLGYTEAEHVSLRDNLGFSFGGVGGLCRTITPQITSHSPPAASWQS